jgi:GntR family transcriptional regulator
VAARLGSDEPVLRIERLRLAAKTPVSYYTHYVPPMTAGAIDRAALGAHPVLSVLQDAGFVAASAEQALTARTAEAAIATELEVPVGTALVCLKRLVRDDRNRPIEYHESLYRPDRYEYRLTLVRGGNPAAPAWVPLAGSV